MEWHHEDDSVFYELYAFSRPNHLLAHSSATRWPGASNAAS